MKKNIIPIEGMHCKSCEVLIEDELKEIHGIKSVKANFNKKQVTYYSTSEIDDKKIEDAISKAGYKIGQNTSNLVSKNIKDYIDLAYGIGIVLLLYLIIKKIDFSIDLENLTQPSSLIIVLFVGLTAGVSTCMALVGGLVLGISARFGEVHPEATPLQKFRPHLFFNLGRLITFFILGGIVGQIGKAFQISTPIMGALIMLVGLVMLVLGIQLIEIFPRISSAYISLPTNLAKIIGIKKHPKKEYSHLNSAIVGGMTFFLPCGFTQAMQLYALSTGSFITGALVMSIFALGTAPGLLGIGGIASVVKGSFAKKFYKFVGILVIALALFNIKNGWNLTGWHGVNLSLTNNSNLSKAIDDPNVILKNGLQTVRMTQSARGYNPNVFKVKKGIPVKWIVNSTSPNTCASALVSRQLNIDVFLKPGDNIFEFIPDKIGTINFSCSMGMYTGKFQVID